jgi:hypothetical protein
MVSLGTAARCPLIVPQHSSTNLQTSCRPKSGELPTLEWPSTVFFLNMQASLRQEEAAASQVLENAKIAHSSTADLLRTRRSMAV